MAAAETRGSESDLWNPGPEGYLGRDVIPYGGTVVVETGIGKISVDTSALPVDPGGTAP
ncbi:MULTISPECIES: hypothetical protein [unclassified Streptomyces]|uniref:Uncharacterized protein n=1 Tax=Streptomyces sp. R33 TaxID=3238629 RepID=A0AB39Y6N1_9ACTN|nr:MULTISPECIES: hypothetical protein [unclassified Streptomyces]TDU76713.1 hypothetical protein EDD91_3430 [Streptomyces sp. KS 21]